MEIFRRYLQIFIKSFTIPQFQYLPIGSDSDVEMSDISDFLVAEFKLDASEFDIVSELSSFSKNNFHLLLFSRKILLFGKVTRDWKGKQNPGGRKKRPRGSAPGIEQQRTRPRHLA